MQPHGTHNIRISKQRSLKNHFRKTALVAALTGAAIGSLGMLAAPAHAQAEAAFDVNLPAQPLGQALAALSRQTGVQVLAAGELVAGKTAAALAGRMTAQQALARLLAGSGLQARTVGQTLTVERAAPAAAAEGNTLKAVTVTANAPETTTGPVRGYLAKRNSTGMKTDTPILETPQSISVVTAERMEAIGATRLAEALGYTPGVNIMNWNEDSRFEWLGLRGFSGYASAYYLDGLSLRNNNTWGVWRTETYGTERIEVLRGPSSVLYGQNTPGGVVNVVTKRPTAEPLREIQVQLGSHSRRQVAGDFSGPLDEDGKVLYRVTGVLRDAQLQAGGMADDRIYIAPSLTWKPTGDTTLTLMSHYIRDRGGVYQSGGPAQGMLLPNPNGKIAAPAYFGEPTFDRFNHDQWMVGYALEHRFNDTWTVRQNARYGSMDVDYGQVWPANTFATVNAADPADPANFRLMDRVAFGSREKVSGLNIDNQLQAKLRTGGLQHTVLFGLDHQRLRYDQRTYYGGTVTPIDVYTPVFGAASITLPDPYTDAITRLVQTGLYVQDQIRFDERWIATLGGRYDRARTRVHNRLTGTDTQQSDGKFTGRAGLVYLHPSGWAPYVSYSESFLPTATVDPGTGKPFSPETGQQYEAGIRYQPPGSKDSYSAAVFDLRRRNYITNDANLVPKQTGEVTVRGLELEAIVQPLPRTNLTVAYTWTPKAVVAESSTASEIGKQLEAVSENQLSVWGDYRFENGVKLGLGARYMGPNRGYGEAALAQLPGYTVFDASLGYEFERWSLALSIRNLTNKAYLVACGASDCGYGSQRRLLTTATYRW